MRSLRWGRGAEEPFGESPPPLETINKGPKRCTFLHTRPTRTSACLSRGKQVGQRPEPPLSLSPQPSQDLETKRADLFFLLPALLPTSKQTQEQEQASQNPRSAPAAATGDAGRRAGPAEADQSRGRPRSLREPVRPPGVSALAPPSPSSATASRPSRCPDSRPSHPAPPPEETKEGSAGSLLGCRRGGSADPSAAAPHTKGLPGPGRSVGALVPAPRAGSHPPAGVCASVHRNAGGGGACGSRAARAGRGGTEGKEGKRPEGPGAKARRAEKAPGGRPTEARGGGRGRQPGSADRRAPLRAPRAPRARLGARRAGGGAWAGRGRRTGRGLGPRAPAGTGNAPWSARPTGSV